MKCDTIYNEIEQQKSLTDQVRLFSFISVAETGIHFFEVKKSWVGSCVKASFTLQKMIHRGYGGGVWISPLDKVGLSIESAASSDEDNLLFFIRFGFMF